MTLSGKAKIAGVIGWPVAHSRSPRLHGFWLDIYNIDGAYLPFPIHPDNLEDCLRALPKLGISGVNATVPHKEAALELCDQVDETATRIGAVNTIVVEEDGSLSGSNTDAFGFIENLKTESDWRSASGPAVVLGAGGAARAVVTALIDDGVRDVRIVNRTAARAQALAAEFSGQATAITWSDSGDAMGNASLLVNTTTLGMTGQPPLEMSIETLPDGAVVNDIVYVPLETDLLRRAKQRHLKTVDGLGMLLHQARPGFAAWFGHAPEVTPALRNHILDDLLP